MLYLAGMETTRAGARIVEALLVASLAVCFLATAASARRPLSKTSYEIAMKAIVKRYDIPEAQALLPITKNVETTANQDHHAGMLFKDEAQALAAITPPPVIAGDHRVLIAFDLATSENYLAMSTWLAAAARGEKTKPPPALPLSWLTRTFKATSDLRAHGYRIGSFTGD